MQKQKVVNAVRKLLKAGRGTPNYKAGIAFLAEYWIACHPDSTGSEVTP